MVWQYLSLIPVGRKGVISSFKWFLPVVATCRGGGGEVGTLWVLLTPMLRTCPPPPHLPDALNQLICRAAEFWLVARWARLVTLTHKHSDISHCTVGGTSSFYTIFNLMIYLGTSSLLRFLKGTLSRNQKIPALVFWGGLAFRNEFRLHDWKDYLFFVSTFILFRKLSKLTSLKIIFLSLSTHWTGFPFKYAFFDESVSDPFNRDETCLSYSDQGGSSVSAVQNKFSPRLFTQ